jgi:hypothetical protein
VSVCCKWLQGIEQVAARTREALVEAIGKALDAVTAKDAKG